MCIIIDPGTENNKELLSFITNKRLTPNTVILTHEHFDHCLGVNNLRCLFDFDLICSEIASQRIKNPKCNFSEYWDEIKAFEINKQPRIVNDNEEIEFGSSSMHFIETPGHSPGSMCIQIKNTIFTGDTILNNAKIPLKLPGSNKEQYKTSIEKLKNILTPGMKIYPGHGEPFSF